MNVLRKKEMDFLSGEIKLWKEQSIITQEQSENILALYEVKERNFRMILFIAGLVLLGLGGVSFIAAHWHELPKIFRVCVIAVGYLFSLGTASFVRRRSQSDTGQAGTKGLSLYKSFLLLASLIFGTGIFLITRMYNYKLAWHSITGWWLVEILITAVIFREEWQLYLGQVFSFLYLISINAIDIFALEFANLSRVSLLEIFSPWNAFVLIIALWAVNYFIRDRLAFNANMLLTLLLIASRMSLAFGGTWALIILAIAGAALSFVPKSHDAEIFGLLMLGLFGLLLTWGEFWSGEIFTGKIFGFEALNFWPVCTALIVAVLMLVNVFRGHSSIGILFCVLLAARYFFDHFFGYMPKAWGFSLTGVIFLIAGLFFGKIKDLLTRKK